MIKRITLILLLTIVGSSFLFSQVRFFSNFDSGSLEMAKIIDSSLLRINDSTLLKSYSIDVYSQSDPLNPVDTSLEPSARWYHFLMTGVKDCQLHLTFYNSDARRPFFSYDGVNYERFSTFESPDRQTIRTVATGDSLYIAYFVPYNLTYLKNRLQEWNLSEDVEISVIGQSFHGRPMNLMTITDKNVIDEGKKVVYIHARVHTSEAPASWHLDGFLDVLASDTPYARALKQNCIFYVVPYTNPDGVFEGLSRSNSLGVNIEINWNRPPEQTVVEIENLKAILDTILTRHPIDIMLNMHSQSQNFTTYYVHTAESTTPRQHRRQLLFSHLTIDNNPYFFKNNLTYSNVAPRYVEGWLWDKVGENTIALTFETPYTYQNGVTRYSPDFDGHWVTTESLREMGKNTAIAIGDYLGISSTGRVIVPQPARYGKRVWQAATDNDHLYFGEYYLVAQRSNALLRYEINYLPAGTYKVYKWVTGQVNRVSLPNENEWREIDTIVQKRGGKFVFRYRSSHTGDYADNLLLIKAE